MRFPKLPFFWHWLRIAAIGVGIVAALGGAGWAANALYALSPAATICGIILVVAVFLSICIALLTYDKPRD